MASDGPVWPPLGFPTPVKDLIIKFFGLADDKSPEAGPRLAEEVFTSSAIMKNGPKEFQGSDEIARSREGAWKHFQSRRHTILKVYTQSEKADDILLLGELTAEFKNGNSATGQFCARIVVGGPETAKPQFRHYEVWADQTPFVSAMKG
ncbi:hypothetical protein MMC08_006064 [Hypocenomyce scalaris]|nr:hypothetical protein [Hypocenomyce scalaris]